MLYWTKPSYSIPQSIQVQKMFCTVGEGRANQPDPYPEEQGLSFYPAREQDTSSSPDIIESFRLSSGYTLGNGSQEASLL